MTGDYVALCVSSTCPPGKFGRDCSVACFDKYYGVQCKHMCSCTDNMKCDPIHGCVCFEGFTGKDCLTVCPSGRYGWNCTKECFCAEDAECDSVTGVCLCSAGRIGSHCTKKCTFGTFGKDCKGNCDCSDGIQCDVITGKCNKNKNPKSDGDTKESKGAVMVYIMMAAAVIGLICVVTMALKAKEALCRMVQKQKQDTTKLKMKRRKAHRPSNLNDNSQTGSFTEETEVTTLELPFEEENLYCEIQDINPIEPVGVNAKMSLRSFSQN
ncbi:Hypothetical predicted protein [Mytilus galloprovincialis]|uniref:Uncharacterized protein n=1 Tax=Mytilus galloprovincialis TaxID=29158 RepID=A0A8B6GRN2_MYTGA|nr:Hypothetical predicted protein [Mytilus galloprovincialis]